MGKCVLIGYKWNSDFGDKCLFGRLRDGFSLPRQLEGHRKLFFFLDS